MIRNARKQRTRGSSGKKGDQKLTNQIVDLCLQPWQEATGTCIKVERAKTETIILLQMKGKRHRLGLSCIQETPESLQGQCISVLKTDDLKRPFLVRKIPDTASEIVATANMAATTVA